MYGSRSSVLLFASLLLEISSFQAPQTILVLSSRKQQQQQRHNNILRLQPIDDDTADDGQINDGADLAKEFFRQQREREKGNVERQDGSIDTGSPTSNQGNITSTAPRPSIDLTRSLFDDESSSQSVDENRPKKKKKFTGRRDDFASSSSSPQIISSRSSSSSRIGGGQDIRSPREVMMQREYELVGRAERGLGLQAIFAVLALAFYIYVGATGGIVSGSDAISDDFGGDDTIYFEQTMPIQRDSETSVFI